MPVHKIEIKQPAKRLLNSDVSMLIYSDGALLGELLISKGSIDWRQAKEQKLRSLTWEQFANKMAEW